METRTSFLEEQGDTGMIFWSHLQKLKADRGPCRTESHSSLQSWSDEGHEEGRRDEDKMNLNQALLILLGAAGPRVLTSTLNSLLYVPMATSTSLMPSYLTDVVWILKTPPECNIYMWFISSFCLFHFFYPLALLWDSSPEIPSHFLMILILRGLVSYRCLRSWNHPCL